MGHKIRYNPNAPESERQACLDMAQYLGFKTMRLLLQKVNSNEMSRPAWQFCCMLAGVRGYPVEAAWMRYRRNDR